MALPPLLSVNGHFGFGPYGRPEFAGPKDLLAHMDRLGVARSLVWHVEARDSNPTWGNRSLLRLLGESSEAQARLIPSFTITPTTSFEGDAMESLKGALASGLVKTLRVFPGTSRFPLGCIERVLGEIGEFDPVVLWSVRDSAKDTADSRDLASLALKFPRMHFIVAEAMWGQSQLLTDLMWRCPNVLADISWMHMQGFITLLCKEFGAHRLVFGLGPKWHHGAAIAALAHADVREDEREQIAHGNMDRLLGIEACAKARRVVHDEVYPEKPLWTALRNGGAVSGLEVLDAHGHVGPMTRGWIVPEQNLLEMIAGFIAQMDAVGIRQTIVSPEPALFGHCVHGNRLIAEALQPYRDRFMCYLVFNPYYAEEVVPLLDEFFNNPMFVGFKILPGYWRIPVTDPRYLPVWEYANRHRLPILSHTWNGAFDSPALFSDIVRQHPDASFILGHSGGGDVGRREAEKLALSNDNVFLEWCGSFTCQVPWEETLAHVGPSRVVFGTDAYPHNQAWELGRLLSLNVPEEKLHPILGANMRAVLARRKSRDFRCV